MRIRGAGRIAVAGLEAIRSGVGEIYQVSGSSEAFLAGVRETEKVLLETRPTAVALPNALSFLDNNLDREARRGASKDELRSTVEKAALEFIRRIGESPERIANLSLPLIPKGSTAITHCHSSVVVAVMKKAAGNGTLSTIYVTETRPLYQGRITATQLGGSGAFVKFITDSAAGFYMSRADILVVGADAIAMNGDLVNKVGTFPMAALAKQLGKKVLVAAESYKIATKAAMGTDILIEFRSPREIYGQDPANIGNPEILNPAFDVTPGRLIDFVVTELEVVTEPEVGIPRVAKKAGLLSDDDG